MIDLLFIKEGKAIYKLSLQVNTISLPEPSGVYHLF
jgi:hypothetical protein